MIKNISISYCEANEKFDIVIDGVFYGKHYTIEEAVKSIPRTLLIHTSNIERIKNETN